MTQESPTHDELVAEEMLLTAGLDAAPDWRDTLHHDIFATEGQPHVVVMLGAGDVFCGVFVNRDACLGWIMMHDRRWRQDPEMDLDAFANDNYTIREMVVLK